MSFLRGSSYLLGTAAFAFLVGTYAHYVAQQKVPVFEAQGSLLFRFGIEYTPANPAFDEWRGDPVRLYNDDAILTELQIVGSRQVLERTIAQLRPTFADVPDVEAMSRRLSIQRIEGTNVARVSYRSEDPRLAVGIVDRLMSVYLEARASLFEQRPTTALQDLAEEAREQWIDAAARLQSLENELAATASRIAASPPGPGADGDGFGQGAPGQVSGDLSFDGSLEMQILRAEVESALRRYETVSELAERFALAERLGGALGSNIQVLETAAAGSEPIGLTPEESAAVAAALGAALGLLAAGMIEWRWMWASRA